MRKINYPTDLLQFKDDYYNSLSKLNEGQINNFLAGIPLIFPPLTFKDLVTEDFENLSSRYYQLENYFRSITPNKVAVFKNLFNYSINQSSIATFFMNKKDDLEIKTCFYCNIDFINSFNDIGEYGNVVDFFNRATIKELKIIPGLDKKATLIYNALKIKNISDLEELNTIKGIGKPLVDNIKQLSLNDLIKYKNHFTLDHFIPQSKCSYFSLSLFNLIPSCYSCNSKFKGSTIFENLDNLKFLSPSSNLFSLNYDVSFKLYFNSTNLDLNENIRNTKILSDIRVDIVNTGNVSEFDTFLEMFKLKGRYVYHKNEALKLVKKRSEYPDTEIDDLARITRRNSLDIKKDIFGSVIFNDNEKNEPFAKYKRDIAEQLRLI